MNEKEQKAADYLLEAIPSTTSSTAAHYYTEAYLHLCEAVSTRIDTVAREREMQADYDNR